MIKVYQETDNDCFRACIASILHCSVGQVPNFMQLGVDKFSQSWRRWEEDKPFILVDIAVNDDFLNLAKLSNLTYIGTGKSPRGDFYHCCIFHGDKMVHDPWQNGNGIEGKLKICTLVVAKNPAVPFCPLCFAPMVKSRTECADGSGFVFGWACECDDYIRE